MTSAGAAASGATQKHVVSFPIVDLGINLVDKRHMGDAAACLEGALHQSDDNRHIDTRSKHVL